MRWWKDNNKQNLEFRNKNGVFSLQTATLSRYGEIWGHELIIWGSEMVHKLGLVCVRWSQQADLRKRHRFRLWSRRISDGAVPPGVTDGVRSLLQTRALRLETKGKRTTLCFCIRDADKHYVSHISTELVMPNQHQRQRQRQPPMSFFCGYLEEMEGNFSLLEKT